MNGDRFCDGCVELDFADAVNAYDLYAARCNDPEKPMTGKHRTVSVSGIGKPFHIIRPAWCRKNLKEKKTGRPTPQCDTKES